MQSGSLPCIFRILNLICFTYIGIALWKSYPYFATPYPDCSIYIRIAPYKLTLTSRSLILISSHHTIFSILPDVAAARLLAAVAAVAAVAAAAGYGGCSWMQRLWRLLLAVAVARGCGGCGGCGSLVDAGCYGRGHRLQRHHLEGGFTSYWHLLARFSS